MAIIRVTTAWLLEQDPRRYQRPGELPPAKPGPARVRAAAPAPTRRRKTRADHHAAIRARLRQGPLHLAALADLLGLHAAYTGLLVQDLVHAGEATTAWGRGPKGGKALFVRRA